MYNSFYSKATNASRDRYQLLPFDQELELLEASRRGIHATDINTHRAKLFASMKEEEKNVEEREKLKEKEGRKQKKSRRHRKKELEGDVKDKIEFI